MSLLKDAESNVAAYVPSLQRTEGQPPPVAANDGLSYMSFDRDGDVVRRHGHLGLRRRHSRVREE